MFQDQKYSECTQKQESFNLKKSASYKVVIVTKQTVHGNLIINVMLEDRYRVVGFFDN